MKYVGYVVRTDTGGEYVGITNDLARRIREHKAKGPLKGARLVILAKEVFPNREDAGLWEVSQIAARGGPDKLLNTSFGGFGGRRRVVTEAEKAHLSRLASDRQAPKEFRDKMRAACKAAWANPDALARLSASAKAACSREDVKARRSAAQKKLWANPTVRAKRIAGITKSRNDPDKAQDRRDAAKKMWKTRRQAQE